MRTKSQTSHDVASHESISKLAKNSDLFVAEYNNKIVGMVSLSSNNLSHIFTDYTAHRKGIGRTLVHYAEERAISSGFTEIKVKASATDYPFYKRLGFKESETDNTSDRLPMRKKLV